MSTQSWRKNTAVISRLLATPGRFAFVQAARLLERAAVFRHRTDKTKTLQNEQSVGRYTPPAKELMRFSNNPAMRFPENEIQTIREATRKNPDESKPHNRFWQVTTNFLGLTGSVGVLPYHYSELLLQRMRKRDRALLNYLDLFNHRIISLFLQASKKYRLPLQYEQKLLDHQKASKPKDAVDTHTFALLSLIGLGSERLQNRQSVPDASLLYYGGLFSQQVRTAASLKQIISDYFCVPVEISEFVGQWQDLIDDVRTRLPYDGHPLGQNASLGRTCMLGRRGWFAQGKVRIAIGPLTQKQHQNFAPGSENMRALNEMVRLYLGMERDFEFNILVNRRDIIQRVALNGNTPPIMGWSTWLSGEDGSGKETADQILTISVSSH